MKIRKAIPPGRPTKPTQSQKHARRLARLFCTALGERTKWKPLRPASFGEVIQFADLREKDALKGVLTAKRWKWIRSHAASGGYVLTDAGREAAIGDKERPGRPTA